MKKVILGIVISFTALVGVKSYFSQEGHVVQEQFSAPEHVSTSIEQKAEGQDLPSLVKFVESSYPRFVDTMLKMNSMSSDKSLQSALQATKKMVENNVKNPSKFAEDLEKKRKEGKPFYLENDIRYFSYQLLTDFSSGNIAEFSGGTRMLALQGYHNTLLDNCILFHEMIHAMQDMERRSQIKNQSDAEEYRKSMDYPLINAEVEAYDYELSLFFLILKEKGVTKEMFPSMSVEELMKKFDINSSQIVLAQAVQIISKEYLKHDLTTADGRMAFGKFLANIYATNGNKAVYLQDEKTGNVMKVEVKQK